GSSKSLYFPSVNFNGSKRYVNGKAGDNLNYGASLDWLLFDFGKRGQDIDREYFSLVSVGFTHNDNITNYVYDIIKSYLDYYSAIESVNAAQTSLKAYQKSYNIAKEKYRVGVVPRSDLFNAETQLAQAKLTLYKAQNAVLIEQGNFNKLLTLEQGQELRLEKPEFIKNVDEIEKNIDQLIDEAVKNREAIAALIAKERAYLAQARAAKLSYLPSISASAGISRTEYDNDPYNQMDGTNNSLSFNISIPIFSGFSRSYNVSRNQYMYESAKYDRENLENSVAYEVWSAYHNYRNSIQNYEAALSLVKSSKQARDVAEGMYKNGRGDILNLMFLEASYTEALNEKILMEYQKLLAQVALLRAVGSLNMDFMAREDGETDEVIQE
ncbi:MAG: TolC family protein, partial [Rickettsiales bacterium]|nr:TolC family protein [Rickettsiales bacterium]